MKKIYIIIMIVFIAVNMQAQIKIVGNNKTIVDNIISGMTYPNISKDSDSNFYLVNSTESKTDNLMVLKLGKKEEALKTLEFFQSFIKNEDAGTFIDIQDESTGYKYRLFRVNLLGQGGLRIESLDIQYNCFSQIFIKSINGAKKIIESSE